MLRTPAHFTPLLKAQDHADALNFLFRGDELLVMEDDLSLPVTSEIKARGLAAERVHPLGLLGEHYCQAVWLDKDAVAGEGQTFRKLRSLFGVMDADRMAIAGRAFQIAEWARTHRFCGSCGTPTQHVAGERCVKCPACGMVAYPRISPAMMVLVKRGQDILLARHAASPTRFFTALAGFLEAGESVEDAVHREVFEEVGLRVDKVQYFGSQPWPFPHSLMIAYTAEYVSGEITIDRSEIAEARWFAPGDELPAIPPRGVSIASHLIHAHLPETLA